MDTLLQDLRYAVRMLAKQPVITTVAVLSLALGIGANTTIFTIINAVYLTPIPVEEPSRLARVYTVDWERPTALTGVSFPNYEDYRDASTVFSGLAAIAQTSVNLLLDDGALEISAQAVTANYFDVLGVEAYLGRTFLPEEDERQVAVAVLSHGIFERLFGADPSVIGSNINLRGIPYTVIGVAPPNFKGLETVGNPDLVWVPMEMRHFVLTGRLADYFDTRRGRFAQVIGRLKDGVTVEQADAEIHTIGTRLEKEFPSDNQGREGAVRLYSPVDPNRQDRYARVGTLMAAVVGVVLLIACVNVANLLLARAAGREKEIGIRITLGAERRRLVRQLLTESVLLSMLAAPVGWLIAFWGRDVLWSYRPPFLAERAISLVLDLRVLGFTIGVALLTGLLFGLVPALQASNPDLRQTLQAGGRRSNSGSNRAWVRSGLVVAEMALAFVALVGAGLFIRSMRNAHEVEPGFETERLVLMELNIGNAGYTRAEGEQFYRELLERVVALPDVEAVSVSSGRLLGGGLPHTTYPEGVDIAGGRGIHVQDIIVSPSYFESVGIPLRSGRLLSEFDREGSARVAVINEATRRLFWPDVDPIGRRFTRSVEDFDIEVVGVVEDALIDLGRPAQPIIYTALRQFYQSSVQLQVRTAGDPKITLRGVQAAIREIDPHLPLLNVTTIADDMEQALWAPRVGSTLLGAFGVLALLLAMVGIYGVMAYSVSQRDHEIGLRIALGAQQGDVIRLIVTQGMKLVVGGLILGVALAFATTRLIQTMLWDVSPTDVLTFTAVSGILVTVALVANLIPAMRVTRVDPLIAMRAE